MRKRTSIGVIVPALLGLLGCTTTPHEILSSAAKNRSGKNFTAHCNGDQEVGPVDTNAQGQATFHLSADGSELSYKLIVANIEDVFASHIHMAPVGVNGGVVAFLYGGGLIPGRTNGVLSEGTITDADLLGALNGMTVSDLVDAIEAGNTYVNVHTISTPSGEIRGQIQ
jgi:hypothetical protein